MPAQKQQDQATTQTEQQYVDGPADLLVEAQQLDEVVQQFKEQLRNTCIKLHHMTTLDQI